MNILKTIMLTILNSGLISTFRDKLINLLITLIKKSSNKIDDMLLPHLDILKKLSDKGIDKVRKYAENLHKKEVVLKEVLEEIQKEEAEKK